MRSKAPSSPYPTAVEVNVNVDLTLLLLLWLCTKVIGRTGVTDDMNPLVLLKDDSIVCSESVLPAGSQEALNVKLPRQNSMEAKEHCKQSMGHCDGVSHDVESFAQLSRDGLVFRCSEKCDESGWIKESETTWEHL